MDIKLQKNVQFRLLVITLYQRKENRYLLFARNINQYRLNIFKYIVHQLYMYISLFALTPRHMCTLTCWKVGNASHKGDKYESNDDVTRNYGLNVFTFHPSCSHYMFAHFNTKFARILRLYV